MCFDTKTQVGAKPDVRFVHNKQNVSNHAQEFARANNKCEKPTVCK